VETDIRRVHHPEPVEAIDVPPGPAVPRLALGGVLRRAAMLSAFVALPAVLFVSALLVAIGGQGDWAFDFHQFWRGAHDVLQGVSPYPSDELLRTSSDELGPTGIQETFRFPYPAVTAVLLVPFALLPYTLAAAILTALLTLCIPVALWLLGVRDWRVHGLAFATITVGGAVRLGTLTPLLLLGLALAWRYRDRRWAVVVPLTLAILAKLFLWPMLVWLVATRRFANAALTALAASVAVLLGWAVIGFAGLTQYPTLVDRLTDVVGDRGYSLTALGHALGLEEGVSRALPFAVGLPLLALVVVAARRRDGDRIAFSLAVVASIVLTPIVWLHYFTLLLAPLALARPRLSPVWLLALAFWATPYQENEGAGWRVVVALGLLAATAVVVAASPRPRASAPA
jgi:hypothetical protein